MGDLPYINLYKTKNQFVGAVEAEIEEKIRKNGKILGKVLATRTTTKPVRKQIAFQKHRAANHTTKMQGCTICIKAKGKRMSMKRKRDKRLWSRHGECTDTDLAGPLPISKDNERYWQLYVDGASLKCW